MSQTKQMSLFKLQGYASRERGNEYLKFMLEMLKRGQNGKTA